MKLSAESVSIRKEITHQEGNQFFINEKHEIIHRKTPNLKLSFYDCVRQLRLIYQKIQDLKTAEEFYTGVLNNWDSFQQKQESELKE